jgi:hypothetical protein
VLIKRGIERRVVSTGVDFCCSAAEPVMATKIGIHDMTGTDFSVESGWLAAGLIQLPIDGGTPSFNRSKALQRSIRAFLF